MLESFKQQESFFFYKSLITMKDVPRDFQNVVDFSDKIFFDAFANDIKMVTQSLNIRKYMQNLEDADGCKTIDDEIDPNMTNEELEFDLVNQIDYLIGFINRVTNNSYQQDVIDIVCSSPSLL